MAATWTKKRILITVRTYPSPARKGVEVSVLLALQTRVSGLGSIRSPIGRSMRIRNSESMSGSR